MAAEVEQGAGVGVGVEVERGGAGAEAGEKKRRGFKGRLRSYSGPLGERVVAEGACPCQDALPIPYITTYIEKVDEYCVVIRGMFGGLGSSEDRRLARERSMAMESHSRGAPPGPTRPPENYRRHLEMSGEGLSGKSPKAVSRFFYWAGRACWIGCCPPLPSPIIHKIVFQPPHPPSYSFITEDGTRLTHSNLHKHDEPGLQFRVTYTPDVMAHIRSPIDLGQLTGFLVRKGNGAHVAAVYLPCEGAPFLFLYSHANAMDIGYTVPFMYKLRRKLGCSVVAYDYSGYGLSSGRCTEAGLKGDVEAVFAHITDTLHLCSPQRVIAYGFSLGTAATAHLATKTGDLAAVVLAGAFISAINCIRRIPSDRDYSCHSIDKFRTYKDIATIQAPTLVCHGLEDNVTGMEQGLWILERCRRPLEPLFLPDTDHNDMDKPPVWSRLAQMIHSDLGAPYPHSALRALFSTMLHQQFPDLHQKCLAGPAVCLLCRTTVARAFFDAKRMKIVGLGPGFVEDARRIRWDVEPRTGEDGGSWEGRFTLTLFSALVTASEVRRIAEHNNKPLPNPPSTACLPSSDSLS